MPSRENRATVISELSENSENLRKFGGFRMYVSSFAPLSAEALYDVPVIHRPTIETLAVSVDRLYCHDRHAIIYV
jgi:hypothetical protein